MLPKHCRIIVYVDSHGRTTARTAAQARVQFVDLRQKGFKPVCTFRAPLRRLRCGWNVFYQEIIGRITATS